MSVISLWLVVGLGPIVSCLPAIAGEPGKSSEPLDLEAEDLRPGLVAVYRCRAKELGMVENVEGLQAELEGT